MGEIEIIFFSDKHTWCIKKGGARLFRGAGNPYVDSTFSEAINSEIGDEASKEVKDVFNQRGFKVRPVVIRTYDDGYILIKGYLHDTGEKICNMLQKLVKEIKTKKEAH